MPRDASGNYVRVTNSFSNPVTATVISSTDADALFDDFSSALDQSAVKTPAYLIATATAAGGIGNRRLLAAGNGLTATDGGPQASLTLAVGAGTGIVVNADDVQLATIDSGKVMGNPGASSAVPVGTSLSALIDAGVSSANVQGSLLYRGAAAWAALAPSSANKVLQTNGAGADPSWVALAGGGDLLAANNLSDVANVASAQVNLGLSFSFPGGRLTIASATPVMTTTVSGATKVFYTPYLHDKIPIYDGSIWRMTQFAELEQATTDTTKSPAAVTSASNYDIFVWNDGGTIRATRGPGWTSATARGTGAGTTELVRLNGIWLNAANITNGPAAQRGTYVGTVRSNGSNQIDWIYGGVASNGVAGFFGVWNAYNRILFATIVGDTTGSWTYAVANTWRAPNDSATMRASFVRGLNEDAAAARYICSVLPGAPNSAVGIGLDSTTAPSGLMSHTNAFQWIMAQYVGLPGVGFHFLSALEFQTTTTSAAWFGNAGTSYVQSGLSVELWA